MFVLSKVEKSQVKIQQGASQIQDAVVQGEWCYKDFRMRKYVLRTLINDHNHELAASIMTLYVKVTS